MTENKIEWKDITKELPFHGETVLIWVPKDRVLDAHIHISTFYRGITKKERQMLNNINHFRGKITKSEDETENNLKDYCFSNESYFGQEVSHWAYLPSGPDEEPIIHKPYNPEDHKKIFYSEIGTTLRWIRLIYYADKPEGFTKKVGFDQSYYNRHEELSCSDYIVEIGMLRRTPELIKSCSSTYAIMDVFVEPKDYHDMRLNYEMFMSYINENFIIGG